MVRRQCQASTGLTSTHDMKRIIDTLEVVGNVELPDGTWELCATACADYVEEKGQLIVRLDSFVRTASLSMKERKARPGWLLKPETVTESGKPEETLDIARDIFRGWVRRVRNATPSLHTSIA
jgi:hypothetical protein